MSANRRCCRVALDVPLRRSFDYLVPPDQASPHAGARVRVPFGRRDLIGVVLASEVEPAVPISKLRPLREVLDAVPLFDARWLTWMAWVATYYHHPLGEVIASAMPVAVRKGRAQRKKKKAGHNDPVAGWTRSPDAAPSADPASPGLRLGRDQTACVAAVVGALGGYASFLLHGVTGSGKTEVYFEAMAAAMVLGNQALLLVPEIALTPQLVARVTQRFGAVPALLHSGLTDRERALNWEAVRSGTAAIVLGTRSAVFTPCARLGIIIVDEEHDASYKQQDGFRYSARDLAVSRARQEGIPVVLGSATPSLESLTNVAVGRYRRIDLPERAGEAGPPSVRLLDCRGLKLTEGLSPPLVTALKERLARGEQSLLFLNRRGYAPLYRCHDCGWLAGCPRCDARLILHRSAARLRCHHCGSAQAPPTVCAGCGSGHLGAVGEGTQRVEERIARLFPDAVTVRVDRDSTARRGGLEASLEAVKSGRAQILIGTQMLAKGHDLPLLTLVGVLDADQGLYSTDFRAPERLFQLLMQVAGRAGRASLPGEVLIQTWRPEHPLMQAVVQHDYFRFAAAALEERRVAAFPPFGHLALMRAESVKPEAALAFLTQARGLASALPAGDGVQIFDPVPAPMARRAGHHRAQLLVQAARRPDLHALLADWLAQIEDSPWARNVRWSLDVDPVDLC